MGNKHHAAVCTEGSTSLASKFWEKNGHRFELPLPDSHSCSLRLRGGRRKITPLNTFPFSESPGWQGAEGWNEGALEDVRSPSVSNGNECMQHWGLFLQVSLICFFLGMFPAESLNISLNNGVDKQKYECLNVEEENPHPSLRLHEQSLERTSVGVRRYEMRGVVKGRIQHKMFTWKLSRQHYCRL